LGKDVIGLEKARTCAFQVNYHFMWAIKCCCKVLVGLVEVGLEEVFELIVETCGY
jgi:hypothetical protein